MRLGHEGTARGQRQRGSDTRGQPRRWMPLLRRIIGTIFLLLAGCAARLAAPPSEPGTRRDPFFLTFWCGPPLADFDDARAVEIAAAGFTVVGPPCEGGSDPAGNLRALDIAARHGLRLWVSDPRFGAHAPATPGWEAGVDAAVADYGQHPALGGYFVDDEPSADEFEVPGQIVARLRRDDPTHLAYVNLLADYGGRSNLGTDGYDDYLERFVDVVHPELLSYDYYPFLHDNDRTTFFHNLGKIRDLAARSHLPFLLIVQAMPHWVYRDPTEAELAWQAFHALAFGARGISYFAYWTPVDVKQADTMKFHYGLVEAGRPTLHYFQAARLNRVIHALASQLSGYRSLGVADSQAEIAPSFPVGPIDAIEGGPSTAGLFAGSRGQLAVLLVNRDYRYGITARLELHDGAVMPDVFDPTRERWRSTRTLAFPLEPGGAQLLRWR